MKSIVNRIYNCIEDELKSEKLYKIPKTTYQDIASYIKTTSNLADKNERNLTSNLVRGEKDLLTRLAIRLLEIRLAKISSNIDEEANGVNLTPEEKYLIEPSLASRKRFAKLRISNKVSSKYVVVRFKEPVSSLIGVDLAKYGPFKNDDVSVLPLDNAKPLLKQGIVQELDLEL
jgi:DNA replication initiation complex subunit (GINS family)